MGWIDALVMFIRNKNFNLDIKVLYILVCLFTLEVVGALILLSVDVFKKIF